MGVSSGIVSFLTFYIDLLQCGVRKYNMKVIIIGDLMLLKMLCIHRVCVKELH